MATPLINISARQAALFACFLVSFEFLTYIANDMIMPAMPLVTAAFNAPESAVAMSLSAYMLGGASLQIFLGPISDCYGRRPIMLIGASLFFLCTILIGCSNSMDHFLLARFLQGMGLCFISVIGYATLQEIFAEMDAIRLIALMANIAIIAPLIGPLIGAVIISFYSWRVIYFIVAVFALIALWGLWRFMPESVGQMKKDGQRIPKVPLSFITVLKNYLALLLNLPFMLGTISLALIGMPCIAWIALGPVILINAAHLSVVSYGLWQIPVFAASIVGNFVLRWLTYHSSIKKIIYQSSVLVILSLLLMFALPFFINDNYIWLMPGLIIYFFAVSVLSAPLARLVLYSTVISKGTASALLSIIVMLGEVGGIKIINDLYSCDNNTIFTHDNFIFGIILSCHNNIIFGLCCAIIGIIYLVLLMLLAFIIRRKVRFNKDEDNDNDPTGPAELITTPN